MTQYLILIYADEAAWAGATPDENAQLRKEHGEFFQRYESVIRGGNALQSAATATSIRPGAADGSTVTDGPFAETKETLGGYYLIEAPDLDAALSWAARCPGAQHGAIEVRPVWAM